MSKKLTYEYVKNFINSTGYTLLSDNYVNSDEKLSILCPLCNNISEFSFRLFRGGQRCTDVGCINERIGASKRMPFSSIINHAKSIGLILMSDSYKSTATKLNVKCISHGHEYNITARGLMNAKNCKICIRKDIADSQRLTYEYVRDFVEKEGYTLLSQDYKNANTKIAIMCSTGHEYKTTFGNFMSGHRCLQCLQNLTYSGGERDMQLFVESFGIPIVRNDRTKITNPKTGWNLELDVWIPSLNKAIEYNGLYWHSLLDVSIKDDIKVEQCKQLGIDLLVISDEQWNNYKEMEMKRIEQWLLE